MNMAKIVGVMAFLYEYISKDLRDSRVEFGFFCIVDKVAWQ